MPTPFMKKITEEISGISMQKAEDLWEEAKDAVNESYSESDNKYWPTVMKIFKAKVKKHTGSSSKLLSRKVL